MPSTNSRENDTPPGGEDLSVLRLLREIEETRVAIGVVSHQLSEESKARRAEHQKFAEALDLVAQGLAAQAIELQRAERDRRKGERLVLDGQRLVLDNVASLRKRVDMIDQAEGERVAREARREREDQEWRARVEQRFVDFERDSINNEAAIELASRLGGALATRVEQSDRARADRRALLVDGARALAAAAP